MLNNVAFFILTKLPNKMAHEKLSPRQKMIGMMYLVLTAMLALNVSKEAVEAFKKVDKGLTLTVANYANKE